MKTNLPTYNSFLNRSAFLWILAVYLFVQGWKPDVERVTLWGEGIAFLLLLNVFRIPHRHLLQRRIILAVYAWIFLMPLYGVISTLFLWEGGYNRLYLIRHLSFFYYGLFFFAGYQAGPLLIEKLSRYWRWIPFLVFLLVCSLGGGIGSSIVLGFVWLVCQKGNPQKWIYYLLPVIIAVVYAGQDHGTSKIIAMVLMCSPALVYALRLWHSTYLAEKVGRFLFWVVFSLVMISLVVVANRLANLMYQIVGAGGTFHQLFNLFPFTDSNGVWRIMLWTYLFDRFMEYPMGVGLGTPLIGPELANFMYLLQKPGDEYTSGAHNSFITFLARLGVPFLVFFIYMCFNTGRMVARFLHRTGFRVLDSAETRYAFAAILTMLVGVIHACFNVVLESPIAAGIFWFQFGLFVRIVGDFLAKTEVRADA